MSCKCEICHEGSELRLVAECRGCKEGTGDLENKVCFSGILSAWTAGMAPDAIILSGTVETQYSGRTLDVFNRLSALTSELDRLSRRGPPDPVEKELSRLCGKCALSPAKMFGGLCKKVGTDIGVFYMDLRECAVRVSDSEFHDASCAKCLVSTKDDMWFVFDKFEELLRFVVKEGFRVVL